MITGAFRLYMTKDGVWAYNDLCYNYATIHALLLNGVKLKLHYMAKSIWTRELIYYGLTSHFTISVVLSGPFKIFTLESVLHLGFSFGKLPKLLVRLPNSDIGAV